MSTPPVVLAIAGTDSGGGAGLAADLATLAAFGVHGTLVVAAVTAQDTTGVRAIHPVPLDVVEAQLDAVLADLPPAVVKTGMLGTADVVRLVAQRCAGLPIVVDPVLRATTGDVLASEEVVGAYRDRLLPVATVITPNADEARALLGLDPRDTTPAPELAVALRSLGPAVVLTGGPLEYSETCTDWLAAGGAPIALTHPALDTANDHGTGCTFASALAAVLATVPAGTHGTIPLPTDLLEAAAREAAAYVTTQLERSTTWDLGAGRGPIAHTHQTSTPKTLHTEEIPA